MAKAFDTRQGGSPEAALAGIGSQLFNLGSVLADEGIRKEDNRQISNFRIGLLAESTERDNFIAENANDPESYLRYVTENRERIREELFKGLTTPGSKEVGNLEFDEAMAKWENGLATSARRQAGRNAVTDFNLGTDIFMGGKSFADVESFTEFQSEGLIHFASIPNATDDEMLAAQRAFTEFNVSQFLLQHGTEDEIKDPNKFVMDQGLDLPSVEDKEQPVFGPDEIANLQKRFKTQQRYAENTADAAREEAKVATGKEAMNLGVSGDWGGAQEVYNKALADGFLTEQEFTTMSRNLETVSDIVAEGGPNPMNVTTNWTRYAGIRRDVIAGRMTKAEIYREVGAFDPKTGKGGIGKTEASLLEKMIETGGSAKDFRDSDGALFYKARFDETLIGKSPTELKTFAEETGYRWYQNWVDENPDATTRQSEEEAWRIARRVAAAAIAGEITTDIEFLPGTATQASIAKAQRESLARFKQEQGGPTVVSDADYDKLPSGAVFRDENGKRFRKP